MELSALLNIKRGTLGHYETGHVKNIPSEELVSISGYFNIPIDILFKINLTKLPEEEIIKLENNNNKYTGSDLRIIVTTVNSSRNENIEYVPVKAKAGYLNGYNDPEFIEKLPVFNLPNLPTGKKYRMFPIEGDSMFPLSNGTMIIGEFVENWLQIKDGTICVIVTISEGIVFKRVLNKVKENQTYIFQSLNQSYKDYSVPINEICEIWKYEAHLSNVIPEVNLTLENLAESIKFIETDINSILNRLSKFK